MRDLTHKNIRKLSEGEFTDITIRLAQIIGMTNYKNAQWTNSGIEELSYYDIDLYRDVPHGATNFIAGALATLHKVNGPHLVDIK